VEAKQHEIYQDRLNLKGDHRSHCGCNHKGCMAQNLEKAPKKTMTQITSHLIEFHVQDDT